jgi:hypothetical protein
MDGQRYILLYNGPWNLTFEGLLDVQRLLGTGLKVRNVSLGLTESHGSFGRDHPLVLLYIDLVTDHDLREMSVLGLACDDHVGKAKNPPTPHRKNG